MPPPQSGGFGAWRVLRDTARQLHGPDRSVDTGERRGPDRPRIQDFSRAAITPETAELPDAPAAFTVTSRLLEFCRDIANMIQLGYVMCRRRMRPKQSRPIST